MKPQSLAASEKATAILPIDRRARSSAPLDGAPAQLPTGVITLMFTDIEGSTQLWERDAALFRPLLDRHNELARSAAHRWSGYEVKSQGDSFMFAFERATSAIHCAIDIQSSLQDLARGNLPVRVRIGLHTGEPFKGYDASGHPDYFGPMVNRAARIADAGHGGQILLSASSRDVAQGALSTDVTMSDLGFHRLRGLDAAEQIFEVRHQDLYDPTTGMPYRFGPLRTYDALHSNLPVYSTSFVGRAQELPELCAMLALPTTRLLTVIGFGGMGKTRLALQMAEQCSAEYPDGAWWVGLDEARTGEAMIARIAYHIGLYVQSEVPLAEQLHNYLRPRRLLLVLDNIEQVPDAAQFIDEILKNAPLIKCVVTSRRSLGLQAERVKEILPLPPADSVNLFVDRACAQLQFQLTEDNAHDITELCRRVEGVPLAIELAASRATMLSPREILQRLDERFKVLQSDAPDLPPRQRALRAAIDWSYGLLEEGDRDLFAQLAVFSGGFSVNDAEAICHNDDVMEAVLRLRRHSLLRAEIVNKTQQTRYFMLDALRDYAADKLSADPQNARAVGLRHAEYFLHFAQERIGHFRDSQATRAVAELESAFDNVRCAMDWAGQHEEPQLCARLALVLGSFLLCRGFVSEALRRLQVGQSALDNWCGKVSREENTDAELLRLKAAMLREIASARLDLFEWQEASGDAQTAKEWFETAGDKRGVAQSLNLLGLAEKGQSLFAQAHDLFERAMQLYEEVGDRLGVALVLNNLGLIEYEHSRGSRELAASHWKRALALHRGLGDNRGIAQTLTNLGALAQESSDTDRAWQMYFDALGRERDLHHVFGTARALSNLGEVAQMKGETARATRLYAAARSLFSAVGSPYEKYSHKLLTEVGGTDEVAANGELRDMTLEELIEWAFREE